MSESSVPPGDSERLSGDSPATPPPLRLSIVGTLEPQSLERLRSGSAAADRVVNPQGAVVTDETASADAHAWLIDTAVFDTRLRLAIERRRQLPADAIHRHA